MSIGLAVVVISLALSNKVPLATRRVLSRSKGVRFHAPL